VPTQWNKFIFTTPRDADEYEKIYRLRCRIVCDEDGFKRRELFPDGLEKDRYDPYSDFFAAFDDKEEAAACVRLVHHSPVGYPIEEIFGPVIAPASLPEERTGEFSRVFVRKDCRNMAFTHAFFDAVKVWYCRRSLELGLDWTVSAVEWRLLRLLHLYGYPFEKFSESRLYAGKMRFPVRLDRHRLCEGSSEKRGPE